MEALLPYTYDEVYRKRLDGAAFANADQCLRQYRGELMSVGADKATCWFDVTDKTWLVIGKKRCP